MYNKKAFSTETIESNKVNIIYIITTVILVILICFYKIGSKSLWGDELSGWYAASMDSIEVIYQKSIIHHLPLFDFLLAGWIRIFGSSEISIRALPAIFVILSIPLVYYLAKLYSSQKLYAKQKVIIQP